MVLFELITTCQVERNSEGDLFGYHKPQLMAIVFCHKERGISVEGKNHLVTVGIVKESKTTLVLLAPPNEVLSAPRLPKIIEEVAPPEVE